jgi:hypothetical protein
MGPLKSLVMLPLAPVTGLRWVTEILADEAQRELESRESPERALAELDARRANGEISEEDAAALEEQLVEQILSRHGLSGEA